MSSGAGSSRGHHEQEQRPDGGAAPPQPTRWSSILDRYPNAHNIQFDSLTHIRRYSAIIQSGRKVHSTVYLDPIFLWVCWTMYSLLDVVGWRCMVTGNWPVYEDLVLEFYSSVELMGSEKDRLSFRLGGRYHEWAIERFMEVFDLPDSGTEIVPYSSRGCWETITHGAVPYKAGRSKATAIRNPVIRYIHKLLSCTIFGRLANRNNLEKVERSALYHMIVGQPVYLERDILEHFVGVASSKDDFVMGGFITSIAQAMGIDCMARLAIGDVVKLGETALRQMRIVCVVDGVYVWSISRDTTIVLPNPEFTTPQNPANLKLLHPHLPQFPDRRVVPHRAPEADHHMDHQTCLLEQIDSLHRTIDSLRRENMSLRARMDDYARESSNDHAADPSH